MTLYVTDWRYEPEPRANAPEEHHIVGGETADGRRIIIAEIEMDRSDYLGPRMSDAEAAEIARLIAAAPDLLHSLTMIAEWAETADPTEALFGLAQTAKIARAAIAKAEGSE